MNTFILVKNQTQTNENVTMWNICTKDKKGKLNVWAVIMDDALDDAGARDEDRNSDKYLMDFTLTKSIWSR